MANLSLESYMAVILGKALKVLRNRAAIVMRVNRSFESSEVLTGSQWVQVPIPSAIKSQAVVPGVTAAATTDLLPRSVNVELTEWREAPFTLTDKEVALLNTRFQVPDVLAAGVSSLVDDVAMLLYSKYKYFWLQSGTIGTPLFDDKLPTDAVLMNTELFKEKVPPDDIFAVANTTTQSNMQLVPHWSQVNTSGSDSVMRKGEMGELAGAFWLKDQLLPTHKNGSMGAGTAIKAATAHLTGVSALTVTGGTGGVTFNEGDLFTIAGHLGNYVARNSPNITIGAAADGVVNVSPGLRVDLSGGEVFSLIGANGAEYEIGALEMHRDAVTLASAATTAFDMKRLGVESSLSENSPSMSVADSVTGLVLRLVMEKQHYQGRISLSILYGAAVTRPELGCRGAGDTI